MKKEIILLFTVLVSLSFTKINKAVFKVEKEFTDIEYFDCQKNQKLKLGNEYWLGSTSAPDFMKSYITFKDHNKEIKIYFFVQSVIPAQVNKDLSTFQSPKRGFSLADLNFIAEYLDLPKPKLEHDEHYIQDIYPYKMMFKEVGKKKYIMVFAITGGRNPEGIKVLKVLEISIDKENQEKYFK